MSRQRFTIRLADRGVIPFTLDVGRRKKLTLTFVEGELAVRVPYGCTNREINDFIVSNTDWIRKRQTELSSSIGLPRTFEQGEKIRLLGETRQLNYVVSDKYFEPYLDGELLNVAVRSDSTQTYKRAQVESFIKALALETVTDCMSRMSELTGLAPQKLRLGSMSSRWGSCSSNGNISINYKVVQFGIDCIEYVCVHELCHLKHMDHSKQFWELVGKFCPDWKRLRDKMKE